MAFRGVRGPLNKNQVPPKRQVPPESKWTYVPQIRTELSQAHLHVLYMYKHAYLLHVCYNEHDWDISED